MKRWLFIVLLFNVCFNQFVAAASPYSYPPQYMYRSPSSMLLPSFLGNTGIPKEMDSLARTGDDVFLSIASAARSLISGVTNTLGSIISNIGGTGKVNEANQRSYINQLMPPFQYYNPYMAVPQQTQQIQMPQQFQQLQQPQQFQQIQQPQQPQQIQQPQQFQQPQQLQQFQQPQQLQQIQQPQQIQQLQQFQQPQQIQQPQQFQQLPQIQQLQQPQQPQQPPQSALQPSTTRNETPSQTQTGI